MIFVPMVRNIDAPADPNIVVLPDVIDKTLKGMNTPGPADQTAMQANRHHSRDPSALGIEHIETVAQIGEKLIA